MASVACPGCRADALRDGDAARDAVARRLIALALGDPTEDG